MRIHFSNHRLSWLLCTTIGLAMGLAACSSTSERSNTYRTDGQDRPLVDAKYSLSEDRKALDEVRSQVPANVKAENDELALSLRLLSETNRNPRDVRSEFDRLVRKKREQFDKDIKKERETFTLTERKKRDDFLKVQKQTRDQFMKQKRSRDANNDFFREQDQTRKEYFADERDRRNDFESDVRERRKSFEDYTRAKVNEFNQEHRAYVKRWDDLQKQKKSSAISADKALDQELDAIRSKPSTPLESGE